jgi:uncharacterized protein DUF5990
MTMEEHEVTVEIVCTRLPGDKGILLGIQKDEDFFEPSPTDLKRIVFRPVLRARRNTDGSPNFLGPFAHGPKNERFIYLVWATVSPAARFGRVKVHLNHLKWTDVTKAVAKKKPIKVTLELTRDDGKLVYASVRPGVARWEL